MNIVTPRTSAYAETPSTWLWGNHRSVTLGDLGLILRRHLWLLLIPLCFVLIPAIVVIVGLKPYYTATATLVVKPIETAPGTPARLDQQIELQTDLEIINSEKMARKAIDAVRLAESPEFNPTLVTEPGLLSSIPLPDLDVKAALAGIGIGPERWKRGESTGEGTGDIIDAEVLPTFREKLRVAPMGESRVILIQFTSHTPKIASDVANTLAELYITHQLDGKMDAKRVATTWLQDRVRDLRTTVEEAERKVEAYRAQYGIIEGRTASRVAEQISTVSTELITARAAADTANAKLREMQAALSSRGPRAVLEAMNPISANVAALLQRDVETRQRQAELLGNYGNSHPMVINNRSEVQSLDARIRAEATNAVAAVQSEAAIANQRARTLQSEMSKLEEELARTKDAEVEMRGLEREAEANRTLLQDFLTQMNSNERLSIEQPDAWVLSAAAVPSMQAGPNRKLLIAGAFIVAGALWLLLVVGAELLENGIKSSDEVKGVLNATPLGIVPRIPGLLASRAALARYVVDKPTSAFTESLRTIYTALLIEQQRSGAGKAIMVTSSVSAEGKSMLVSSLGRMIARHGQKVLVIDADLRRPNVERLIGHRNLQAPADLPSENPIAGLIQEDSLSGAHVITASKLAEQLKSMGQPTYLLHPTSLTSLLAGVRHLYDIILIDSPPVAPVADARALSLAVDHCIFVVQWRKTSPRTARYALDQLRDAGARVSGVVVTQVESKRHALYGYGDSAVTSKSAYRYYSS